MRTIYIDTTDIKTDMCEIGGEFETDKSPFAINSHCCGHRKGFTGVYSMLFSPYRNKEFNFAELGIEVGASLQLWSAWFPKATIHAFDINQENIKNCRELNIPRVSIHETDVSNKEILDKSFADLDTQFDIIIDDSSHITSHQNILLKTVHKYLKPGGIFIIEDLYRKQSYADFNIDDNIWAFHSFITCHHDKRECWDNDKILYLVKK